MSDDEESAAMQYLQEAHAKKVKALMTSIKKLKTELDVVRAKQTEGYRSKLIDSLKKELKQQALVSDVLKQQLCDVTGMGLTDVNDEVLRKTVGGPLRFRPVSRESLQNDLKAANARIRTLKKKLQKRSTESRSQTSSSVGPVSGSSDVSQEDYLNLQQLAQRLQERLEKAMTETEVARGEMQNMRRKESERKMKMRKLQKSADDAAALKGKLRLKDVQIERLQYEVVKAKEDMSKVSNLKESLHAVHDETQKEAANQLALISQRSNDQLQTINKLTKENMKLEDKVEELMKQKATVRQEQQSKLDALEKRKNKELEDQKQYYQEAENTLRKTYESRNLELREDLEFHKKELDEARTLLQKQLTATNPNLSKEMDEIRARNRELEEKLMTARTEMKTLHETIATLNSEKNEILQQKKDYKQKLKKAKNKLDRERSASPDRDRKSKSPRRDDILEEKTKENFGMPSNMASKEELTKLQKQLEEWKHTAIALKKQVNAFKLKFKKEGQGSSNVSENVFDILKAQLWAEKKKNMTLDSLLHELDDLKTRFMQFTKTELLRGRDTLTGQELIDNTKDERYRAIENELRSYKKVLEKQMEGSVVEILIPLNKAYARYCKKLIQHMEESIPPVPVPKAESNMKIKELMNQLIEVAGSQNDAELMELITSTGHMKPLKK